MRSIYSNLSIISIPLLYIFTYSSNSIAQVNPDKSLGINRSQISRKNKTLVISGGNKTKSINFHSFKSFNVRAGERVYFSPENSTNAIIIRVKNDRSFFDGELGVLGPQHLLIANPNGITFRNGFRINTLGKLLITTANKLTFSDGNFINTGSNKFKLNAVSLDTLNLNFNNSKDIIIRNSPITFTQQPFVDFIPVPIFEGNVPQGLTSINDLFLLGGDIKMNRGVVNAISSNTFIQAIKKGNLSIDIFDSKIEPSFDVKYGKIKLDNLSQINLLNNTGKKLTLQLRGSNISLVEGSFISSSQFVNNISPSEIKITSDTINFSSFSNPKSIGIAGTIRGGILSTAFAGNGAFVDIVADYLNANLGSGILSQALNSAKAGNIYVNANEKVSINGFFPNSTSFSGIGSIGFDSSKSGDIKINANSLHLIDSGAISTYSVLNAQNSNIEVSVTNDLFIGGQNKLFSLSSRLQSVSLSSKKSGNVTAEANNILITDGGGIGSGSNITGDTGSVFVKAETIDVRGSNSSSNSLIFSAIEPPNDFLTQQIAKSVGIDDIPVSGNSGILNVTANQIKVSDNAEITVRNVGQGDAGKLILNSNSLQVNDNAEISALTQSGDGGNIFINTDNLTLKDASILTNAQGQGIGGNIEIKSGLLSLLNKGQILANAQQNRAGNITIFSDASVLSNNSVIAASSLLGPQFSGNIDLNIQNQQVIAQQRIAPTLKPGISVSDACSSGKNSLTEVPRKLHDEFITDPELIKAADLKKRQEAAEQFKFRDESGKVHTFRRWLGVEKLEGNKARFIYSSNQSDKLKKMLSSLDSKCKSFTS